MPVYDEYVRRYPGPGELARESAEGLYGVVGTLGLRWRVPLMLRMAELITDAGSVPKSLPELTALPGVGPYAAGAFLSMHSGVRALIIDSNVVRWLGRVLELETGPETRRQAWFIAIVEKLTPRRAFREFNYAMLDLAMTVCKPRPRCRLCPLARGLCTFRRPNPKRLPHAR